MSIETTNTIGSAPREQIHSFEVVLLLILLTGAAAYIRVSGAGEYHYSPDEMMHVDIAKAHSLGEMLKFSLREFHPPLGHVLRYFWMKISDDTAFDRSLSLVFGLALIPLYYAIGKKLLGPQAGLYSALIMAFSYGCIEQSYVARNYTIFVFFLSAGLLCYLSWRKSRDAGSLIGYLLCGACACLTHFSAPFAIGCVGLFEFLSLLRSRAHLKTISMWGGANLVLAVLAAILVYYWQSMFAIGQIKMVNDPGKMALSAFYPFLAFTYLFPYRANAVFQLLVYVLTITCFILAARQKSTRSYVVLTLLALAVGTLLVVSGIYYTAGANRYSLWLAPFVIPVAGCGLGVLCDRAGSAIPGNQNYRDSIIFLSVIALGLFTYSPSARFEDTKEYVVSENAWHDLSAYLNNLGPSSLIISDKLDAMLITSPDEANWYRYHERQKIPFAPFMLPYGHTRVLSKLWCPHIMRCLYDTLSNKENDISQVKTFVFTTEIWSYAAVEDLFACTVLKKKIIAFPDMPPQNPQTINDFERHSAYAVEVGKDNWFAVFSPSAPPGACGTGKPLYNSGPPR